MALRRPHKGDENGLAPGTGNHKGCPYNKFAGAYFRTNDNTTKCSTDVRIRQMRVFRLSRTVFC